MVVTLTNRRLNGCLFGPASDKDYRTVFKDLSVPDRVDLRDSCTAVENQGQIGSCTANAVVGAVEYHYKRRDGRSPDLSRMFVYYNSRRMRGTVMYDTGAQIREAMASFMAFGSCREEIWPYDPMLFASEPTPDAYADATTHEAIRYARVDGVQGSIAAVAKGLPVVFGTLIPERCYVEAERSGAMPTLSPGEQGNPAEGGHSMLIVGYDNPERVFIVRNSWGEEWGERGYCRIPYDTLETCSRPEEFWVIAELEKEEGFQLVRPGKGTHKYYDDEEDDYRPQKSGGARLGGLSAMAAKLRDQIHSGLEADLSASSRKIDTLLAGKGGARGSAVAKSLMPCTACAGSGVCAACHKQNPRCPRCRGTGACPECGGTGEL